MLQPTIGSERRGIAWSYSSSPGHVKAGSPSLNGWRSLLAKASVMSDAPPSVYQPAEDATIEGELSAVARAYRLILGSRANKKTADPAPEPDSRDVATVKNIEGVTM